jgi:hypothetical protein
VERAAEDDGRVVMEGAVEGVGGGRHANAGRRRRCRCTAEAEGSGAEGAARGCASAAGEGGASGAARAGAMPSAQPHDVSQESKDRGVMAVRQQR